MFHVKETDKCPNPDVIEGQSLTVQKLMQLWPRLVIVSGILCRWHEDLETKQEFRQLVVLRIMREEVMGELHGGVKSDHLRESKTLQQLKKQFY